MAAPPDKFIGNLNGRWLLNKTLSDDYERVMSLQGVAWLVRKAICRASTTISIRQEGVGPATTIALDNTSNLGVQGTTEVRQLDWEFATHNDFVWGNVRGRSKFVSITDTPAGFPAANARDDAQNEDSELLYNEIEALNGSWKSQMLWGFEIIDGSRYFVRHVKASRGSEHATARLVYNYLA
ncbi:hypothetical protein BKA66DRAFT_567238 [Pyrenochaeta sp. MPI-SDFR-AT-0127]|nr:hypothetical protein BKA66DRAFT_567238 [Pyrenochaeta sp. MPI-SDFR-AT-0127]